MRPPRLTILRLMLIVAVVGFGIQAVRLARLSMSHLDQAAWHRRAAQHSRSERAKLETSTNVVEPLGVPIDGQVKELLINYFNKIEKTHINISKKYQYSAYRPWMTVPPDPLKSDPFPPISIFGGPWAPLPTFPLDVGAGPIPPLDLPIAPPQSPRDAGTGIAPRR